MSHIFERGLFLMKSLCIKNNNTNIIVYLLDKLQSLKLDSLSISNHKFKIYENVVIHYNSDSTDLFYDKVSSILTDTILTFFEEKLLKRTLEYNYFYFTVPEKQKILSFARDFIDSDTISKEDNYFSIYYSVLDYIKQNKSFVLDGFVNFRLQNYMNNLDYIIDISVNKFLIEKEYDEFVNLLKLYISLSQPKSSLIHLIYYKDEIILLDSDKKIIKTDDSILNAKYLSDIDFSSNDYALNTLLNLLPKKLIIHLVYRKEDEFINTLKIIFQDRIQFCTDCKICSLYKANLLRQ